MENFARVRPLFICRGMGVEEAANAGGPGVLEGQHMPARDPHERLFWSDVVEGAEAPLATVQGGDMDTGEVGSTLLEPVEQGGDRRVLR